MSKFSINASFTDFKLKYSGGMVMSNLYRQEFGLELVITSPMSRTLMTCDLVFPGNKYPVLVSSLPRGISYVLRAVCEDMVSHFKYLRYWLFSADETLLYNARISHNYI